MFAQLSFQRMGNFVELQSYSPSGLIPSQLGERLPFKRPLTFIDQAVDGPSFSSTPGPRKVVHLLFYLLGELDTGMQSIDDVEHFSISFLFMIARMSPRYLFENLTIRLTETNFVSKLATKISLMNAKTKWIK